MYRTYTYKNYRYVREIVCRIFHEENCSGQVLTTPLWWDDITERWPTNGTAGSENNIRKGIKCSILTEGWLFAKWRNRVISMWGQGSTFLLTIWLWKRSVHGSICGSLQIINCKEGMRDHGNSQFDVKNDVKSNVGVGRIPLHKVIEMLII